MTKPLVSVCTSTYNHAQYLRQCLDSILMQKCNFSFEVLIHDDASNDGTQEIIREYASKYPEIIKPYFQSTNQFPNAKVNLPVLHNYSRVQGKYVALCEGDDFWTDKFKLQKQVDFLESNPDFAICFHLVKVFYEDKSRPDSYFPAPEARKFKSTLELEEIIYKNFMQTNSILYRWRFHTENILDFYPNFILPGDWYLSILHAQTGKIAYLDECMSAYRKHRGGIWWNVNRNIDKHYLSIGIRELNFRLALHHKIYKGQNPEHYEQTKLYADYLLNLFLTYNELTKLQILLQNYFEHLSSAALYQLAWNASKLNLQIKLDAQQKIVLFQEEKPFAELGIQAGDFINLTLLKLEEKQKELQISIQKSQKTQSEFSDLHNNYKLLEQCTQLILNENREERCE